VFKVAEVSSNLVTDADIASANFAMGGRATACVQGSAAPKKWLRLNCDAVRR
jgi:hypothetical protein